MSKAETTAIIKTIAQTAVLLTAKPVEATTKDYLDAIDDIIADIPDDPEPTPEDNPDADTDGGEE